MVLIVATLLPLACSPAPQKEVLLSGGIMSTISGTGNPWMTPLSARVPAEPLATNVGTPWSAQIDRQGELWVSSFLDTFYRQRRDGKIELLFDKHSRIEGKAVTSEGVGGMTLGARFTVFDFMPNDDLVLPDMWYQRVYYIPRAGDWYDLTRARIIDFGSIEVERPSAARVFRGKIYVVSADDTMNGPGASYVVEYDPATKRSRIVAGNGMPGYSGDGGPVTQARINPIDVAFRPDGLMAIADNSSSLRAVNLNASGTLDIFGTRVAAGTIQTFCGKDSNRYADEELIGIKDDPRSGGGFRAYSYRYAVIQYDEGDEGPASKAKIDWPFGPSFDSQGRFHFIDSDNHRLRVIDRAGIIHWVAGNAAKAEQGQGLIGSPGGFYPPAAMGVMDMSGMDYCRRQVCPWYPRMMYFYGGPDPGKQCGCFSIPINDGKPGREAALYHPMGLKVIERDANTFDYIITDSDNARVRKLTGVRFSG